MPLLCHSLYATIDVRNSETNMYVMTTTIGAHAALIQIKQTPIHMWHLSNYIVHHLNTMTTNAITCTKDQKVLDSHRRDPGSIPCNVTSCPNLEIGTQKGSDVRGLRLQELNKHPFRLSST
jgi:hypothetical protein